MPSPPCAGDIKSLLNAFVHRKQNKMVSDNKTVWRFCDAHINFTANSRNQQ